MKVFKAIKPRSYYKNSFDNEPKNLKYVGECLYSNEIYLLKPNDKFILQREKITQDHHIYFETNKYIVKETNNNEIYIKDYKSFYENHKEIICICIGSIITNLDNIFVFIYNLIKNYV